MYVCIYNLCVYVSLCSYELSGCQVVWVIKDGSIGSTFFDEGAATFFLPHLTTPHHSSNTDTSSTDISTGANDTTANDIPTGANDVTATDGDSAVVTQSKPLKRMRYLLDPVGEHNNVCIIT